MSKTDQATSPGGGPQVGQAAPPGTDISKAPQPVCLGPENKIAPRFSVWRKDPCFCLGSSHLHVSSTPVWGWKEKGDWSSLKGAAYIQVQRPLPPNPRALSNHTQPTTETQTWTESWGSSSQEVGSSELFLLMSSR